MRITKKESLQGLEGITTSKKIGNNTFEVNYNNGDRVIRLHNTNIITFKNDGSIILNSGGWKTLTTKDRINNFSGLTICQKAYNWYVIIKNDYNNLIAFYDGMTFNSNLELITDNKTIDLKKQNKTKNQIKKYVSLIDKMETLPFPNNGDCFYCSMKEIKTNRPLGDLTKSDHLNHHIKEGYLHGSILINAMRESGYTDDQIGIHYQMNYKDTFKRSLYKYLFKRLITN